MSQPATGRASDKMIPLRDVQRLGEIGRGSFAVVYKVRFRARADAAPQEYAMKCVRAVSESVQKAIMREVEALAEGVGEHPAVMRLEGWAWRGVGPDEQGPVLLMPYMKHGSLQAVVDRRLVLSPTQKWLVLYGTARGMAFVHDRLKLVHRDLKPANIMLDENFWPVITDFGLARRDDLAATVGPMVGSPVYMAQEILSGAPQLTSKVDVWAFGVTMYELLTQSWAFAEMKSLPALITSISRGARPNIDRLPPSCPPALKELMRRCWATDPKDRPSFRRIARWLGGSDADHVGLIPAEVDLAELANYRARIDAAEK